MQCSGDDSLHPPRRCGVCKYCIRHPLRDAEAVAEIKAHLATLESERRAALVKVQERFPEFDRLTKPKPTEATAVAMHLRPDEVLLSLLPTAARTYQWLVSGEGVSFAASEITEPQVRRWVAELRKTLDVAGQTHPPPIDADAAYQLYRTLIAPLRDKAEDRSEWIIAGGGVLGQLPYAALLTRPSEPGDYTAAAWLVNDMGLTVVPSASAWIALRHVVPPKGDKEPLVAFADPSFGYSPRAETATPVRKLALVRHATICAPDSPGSMPALAPSAGIRPDEIPPLPETRDEVLAIAKVLAADTGRDVFLGPRASRPQVLHLNATGELAKRRVVMFATHGLVPGDLPNLNEPALALAYTGHEDHDWLLTLADVLSLKLDADWVVLSACNTAAADGRSGEALSGLARGFFYAGARSLLVTHWAVESESARMLTTKLFSVYASGAPSRAQALRTAQLSLIGQHKTAHPAYWAAFALVGDGTR